MANTNRDNVEVYLSELVPRMLSSQTTQEDKESFLTSISEFDPDPIENDYLFQAKIGLLERLRNHPLEAFQFAQRYEAAYGMEFLAGRITIGTAKLLGQGYFHYQQFSKARKFFKLCEDLSIDRKPLFQDAVERCDRLLAPVLPPPVVDDNVDGGSEAPSVSGEASESAPSPVVDAADTEKVVPQDEIAIVGAGSDRAPIVSEEDSALQQSLKRFDISFDVEIIKTFNDRVFSGIMKNSCGKSSKTFIKSTKHQDLEKLQSLREGLRKNEFNKYILPVESMVDYDGSKFLICGESVEPLDHYFQTKCDEFITKTNNPEDKKKWWDDIAECFTNISRHVIRGLRLLYDFSPVCCGDLKNSIYVTKHGEGRILPTLHPKANQASDISDLKKKMISIIGLPFGDANPIFESYGLPDELLHFMSFVIIKRLHHVRTQWILDHPWIWTPEERVNFIKNLKNLIDRRVIIKHWFNIQVSYSGTYGTAMKCTWQNEITPGVFQEIYKLAGTQGIAEYVAPVDIQRYMNAAYTHVNEPCYAACPDRDGKTYTSVEVEECLRRFFPKVYTILYQSVYFYAKRWKSTVFFEDEMFLELASRIVTSDDVMQ